MTTHPRWVGRATRLARRSVRRLRPGPTGPRRHAGTHDYPQSFQLEPRPARVSPDWPEPPPIERPFEALVRRPETAPRVYDLALFEALNLEFAARPVAPKPPRYDPASMTDRSRIRLETIHERMGLAGMTVLEVGCGAGYEVWYLSHHMGCDAWGIDVSPRRAWQHLAGERVHLVEGDIAEAGVLPDGAFDRVISFTVWEHIRRPVEAIAQLHRTMRPGGLAWIRANLHRGPTASHRARDIAFPFPHLLFTDDVIAEGLRRAGRPALGAAWVNRLTWEQYEAHLLAAGFEILALDFDIYPLDEAFYGRFEDVLGRYPRVDLERGFFTAVLRKPVA